MTNDSLLAELETDMSPEAAALFTALATQYLADTRTGDGPVGTSRSAAELAARFDEPMPQDGTPRQVVSQYQRELDQAMKADAQHTADQAASAADQAR